MFEPNKEYKTRDGRRARVYAVDGHPSYPIHGAVLNDGDWYVDTWTADGRNNRANRQNSVDLIPPRKTIVRWVNIYPNGCAGLYYDKQEADNEAAPSRAACKRIEIDYAPGEFDE